MGFYYFTFILRYGFIVEKVKTVFSTVSSNSDWQWTVELRAGWLGFPLSTVSRSCKEQLKIGLYWPVVRRLTFSGVGRMITCRRLNILCRVNTKGKWQIQRRMSILRCIWHFPFVFTLQRICRRLQVIIHITPENVKRHTTGQKRPVFNCSLQLLLTVDSRNPRHWARSSSVHCQTELLGTVENNVFASR